jgi:hypothetical protein
MSRATVICTTDADRSKAAGWAMRAPPGTRIEFKSPKRSIPQNDRMWAMLTDVADQMTHHGQKLKANDWKLLFLNALGRENRVVPNLDGDGVVNLGMSSSDLSKEEMSDLMLVIAAWGSQNGVKFGDRE